MVILIGLADIFGCSDPHQVGLIDPTYTSTPLDFKSFSPVVLLASRLHNPNDRKLITNQSNRIKEKLLEYLSVKRGTDVSLSEIVRWWVLENQADKIQLAFREFVDRESREIVAALKELKQDGYVEETTSGEQPGFRLRSVIR